MVCALLGAVKTGLGNIKARARGSNFARGGRARSNQLGKRIEILLRLIACQAVLRDFGSGGLPFCLGSVVGDGIQSCLRRLHTTLGAGDLRTRSRRRRA